MSQRMPTSGAVLVVALAIAGCTSTQSVQSYNPLKALSRADAKSGQAGKAANHGARSVKPSGGEPTSGDFAMARLAERRGQMTEACQLYQALLAYEPENATLHHRLGVIHAREGRFEEADASFGRALAAKPDDPKILCDLGYSYYLQQRLDDARATLEKATKLEPYDEAICNNLALVYGEQGHYDLCLRMFHRTCDDARAYANLAFVYAQQGDLEHAKAMYNRALTLDKSLRPAAEALVQLEQMETRTEEFSRIAKEEPTQPDGPRQAADTAKRPSAAAPQPAQGTRHVEQVSYLSGADAPAAPTPGEVAAP